MSEFHGNQTLPVIPLRGIVVLPGESVRCDAGRPKTIAAMKEAMTKDGIAFFCAQRDASKVELQTGDLYTVGTICRIKQVLKIQGDGLHILVTGLQRARVDVFTSTSPYVEADVCPLEDVKAEPVAAEALRRRVMEQFAEFAKLSDRFTSDQFNTVLRKSDAGEFADAVGQYTLVRTEDKQAILEKVSQQERLWTLLPMLSREMEIMRIDKRIASQMRESIEKSQKDYYLREKIKAVQKELGEDTLNEAEELFERLEKKSMPDDVREKTRKEIERLKALQPGSHEQPMMRAYIECLLDLPWTEQTEDNLDLHHARQVLDEDHFGMDQVKDRIVEYLAVQKRTNLTSGQILCFVGPPGVGKTSIAASIARAMGRKFVRMSLGGVHDEAEIRGHRRTYIGAMPGRIISAMRQAGTINPVLLFDEIDKLGNDYRGDPTSAMLEVLDGAQNFAFRDHFLEIPYDLSHAMILITANDASAIPKPLYDRMEVIEMPSYLATEKLQIARRHLFPKQLEKHGITRAMLRVTDTQLQTIIDEYTRESGVRELERTIGTLCRKAVCELDEKKRIVLSMHKLREYLGKPKYLREDTLPGNEVGAVTGLAWTAVGGETLIVEAAVIPGTGNMRLTGHLGDVMQESGYAAMTYVRAHSMQLGLEKDFYSKLDVHIHVPQGAVPKDGPSAGVTMTTALVSALTGAKVKPGIAMTGEITLRGRVLPIGGLREKLLAAVRAGVHTVIVPADNRADVAEVPEEITQMLQIVYASRIDEVLIHALQDLPATFFAEEPLQVFVHERQIPVAETIQ